MSNLRHGTLSEILADEIATGQFPLGTRFPTEHELQKRFNVGRHTVREALKTLTAQGMLGRRQRIGTTVLALKPFAHYAHTLRDTSGLYDFAGDTVLDVSYLGYVREPAFEIERSEGESPVDKWLRIAGVRSQRGDGSPLCWSEIYVPSCFPLERDRIRGGTCAVYQLTMDTHGLRLNHVEQEIVATVLPDAIADLLLAEPSCPALQVTRRYIAHTNATFEFSVNIYPAGRYSVRSIIR